MEDIGLHARKTQDEFKSLGNVGDAFSKSLGSGIDDLTRGMTNAFDRFARTGKLSFSDLKNVAVSALDSIYDQAVSAGLNSLLGGGGGIFGSLLSGLGGASFAPRAMGGPVSAGQPFLVGEAGPEIFVPGQQGRIHRPQNTAGSAINVTINMGGDTGGGPRAARQSASQIASHVSRAVTRAQRNG